MASGLKRDLGLPATTAIAVGAMVGSGIFILPGLAFVEAGGPSVIAAFLVASILILPAALSASEMATAMPEDGGSYVYVERGMGPLFGTLAGVGNWFMLSFKGALALVGGAPYVVFVLPAIEDISVPVFGDPIVPLALVVGLLFILLNVVSTSSTGSLQFVIVGIMVVVMGAFVVGGFPSIESGQVDGAFNPGSGSTSGFLAATALVFISYAGVIKVAAVAEEVKDPGRVIPRAMVGSLVLTTALYVAIVYVAIGIVDIDAARGAELTEEGEGAIMSLAAEQAFSGTLQTAAIAGVTIAALLALASTANAGLLSASRFPFAMARDGLAPPNFETVSERFDTPAFAVGVTGGLMLLMIATLPIQEVAKFGSAFQIIVFILVNLALIGFREGAIEEYNPEFTAPLYPWVQLFGMAGGFVVLTQIGLIPFVGAGLITAVSVVYYYAYARKNVDRESAVQVGGREAQTEETLERTRDLFDSEREYDVLIALTEGTDDRARRDMLRVASDLGRLRSAAVSVVEFRDEPHHLFPSDRPSDTERLPDWLPDSPEDAPDWLPEEAFDDGARTSGGQPVDALPEEVSDTQVSYRQIVTEDHKEAIVDFATYEGIDLLITGHQTRNGLRGLLGADETEWLLQHAPCDVALVRDRGFDEIDEIAVASRGGSPYDPLKLLVADAIAEEADATINLMRALPADAPDSQRESAERYHNELTRICTVPVRSTVLETDDPVDGMARFAGDADLLVVGVGPTGLEARVRGNVATELVEAVGCTAVMVQTVEGRRRGLLERIVRDYVF